METKSQGSKEKERLYGGIDLHKSYSVIYLMDELEKRVASKSILTNYESFKNFFSPYLETFCKDVQKFTCC